MPIHHRRPCIAEGCTQLARNLSRFCARHLKAYTAHGHPKGRTIRGTELKPFRADAERLLRTYRSRQDVTAALEWLDRMLAEWPDDDTGAELRRLKRQGVTPGEVFVAALTVYGFHRKHPRSLPDDARLTHALSRQVLKLRRKPRRMSSTGKLYSSPMPGKALRDIGLRIREALPLLFLRLFDLDSKRQAEEGRLRYLIRHGDEALN